MGLACVVVLAGADIVGALCGPTPLGVCQDKEIPLAPFPAPLWDRPVPPCHWPVAQQPRPGSLVLLGPEKGFAGLLTAMQPSGCSAARVTEEGLGGFGGGLVPEPYDSFMRSHLRYYGYFRGEPWPRRGLGRRDASPQAPPPAALAAAVLSPRPEGGRAEEPHVPRGPLGAAPHRGNWYRQHRPWLPAGSQAGAEL